MKKTLFLCATIMLAASGLFYFVAPCWGPACYFRKHLTTYKTTSIYQNTDRLLGILLERKHNKIRADAWTNIAKEDADEVMNNFIIKMHALYEKAASPYPGEVSNAISCAEEYRPKYSNETNNGRETHLFVGFANDRLAFGACEDDLITKRASVVMYYCAKQKRLYKFELFTPISESVEMFTQETNNIRSLSCE